MQAGSLLLGLALLIVVAVFVLRPLVERRPDNNKDRYPVPNGRGDGMVQVTRDGLLRQRDAIYAAIRELDFDFGLGKISEEDYRPQRERLVAQGVEVLKQLDALPPDGTAGLEAEIEAEVKRLRQKRGRRARKLAAPMQVSDEEIETQVRALRRRQTPASSFCAQCGAAVQPDDRFCRNCGAALGSRGESVSATGA